MTTAKTKNQQLAEIRDQVPEASVKDPFVATFIDEFKLNELESEIVADADEREYLYDKALNRVSELEKERAKAIKAINEHPDVLMLQARSKALQDRLFTTVKGEFGKIPQVPPKGELSKKYNTYNDAIKELKNALYTRDVADLDIQIESAKAQLDMAQALAAAEDREWKAGRQEKE